jgi:hypothetical protein
MATFLETTFGPAELEILETVLDDWRHEHSLHRNDPDVSLAAAVMINLFREGNNTVPRLKKAVAEHKALSDLMA